MEYLRVGGIFKGNIPPTNSSEAKNAGGMYPISSSPFEEFGGIFLTAKIFYHLFLIGFDKMAEKKKELDERILLVLLPIMLLQIFLLVRKIPPKSSKGLGILLQRIWPRRNLLEEYFP